MPSPMKSPKALPPKSFLIPQNKSESVEEFLKGLELDKYWPLFRDEEVDFVTLLTFNDLNLKEIGIG